MGFGVWGVGFGVWGVGFGVWVWGLIRLQGWGFNPRPHTAGSHTPKFQRYEFQTRSNLSIRLTLKPSLEEKNITPKRPIVTSPKHKLESRCGYQLGTEKLSAF